MELLIVLVVVSIVLAIAVPSFGEFRRNSDLTSASNDILASFQLARTEAIKRQQTVSVCSSANPQANPGASCSGGPFVGWIVFSDPNADCQRSADETVVGREGPLDNSLRASSAGVCATFAPTGFAVDLPDGVEADRLLFCDQRGLALQTGTDQSAARGITISRMGRPSLTRDPDVIASWGLPCP